jgi:RNA-directed DNA polymerase
MPFSADDLADHAGASIGLLEALSLALPTSDGRLYDRWTIRKKHGGIREVFTPYPPYDAVTKNLHRTFTDLLPYKAPAHVHGFVRGRSTISNASQHLGKSCVLRLDLEDFFPSISSRRIKSSLQAQGYEEKAAELAVGIVTIAGKLPIGISTSPYLSNLAFLDTDNSLADYAQSESLSFTRYVDDLTLSGEINDRHLADVSRILDEAGWSINTRKTAFMRRGRRQYVTGLYVGEANMPRIPRKIKHEMRATLHIIKKFGYDTYMAEFGGEAEEMQPYRLKGWACYIASVEPDVGFPLLREFGELLPEGHWTRSEEYFGDPS